jgi:hypothetical protein
LALIAIILIYSLNISPYHQLKQIDNIICENKQSSIFTNWVNLLGRLIILVSFGSLRMMDNSVLIERYVKVIFQDILPVFLIVFLALSLVGIASAIAVIYFPSSAGLTTSSLSPQNSCILK